MDCTIWESAKDFFIEFYSTCVDMSPEPFFFGQYFTQASASVNLHETKDIPSVQPDIHTGEV
jgi:hypothetical protein